MLHGNIPFHTQTKALLFRSWHYERRQYYSILCTLIVPSFALVFLALLGRIIKPRPVQIFSFQQKPKGAFVPRTFNPIQCVVSLAPSLGVKKAIARCARGEMLHHYTVPVFAPPHLHSLVGQRTARNINANSGLLSGLSLDPFVYPQASDDYHPNTITFFDTQTSYDGIFLYSYFLGSRDNLFYRVLTIASGLRLTDWIYDTTTKLFDNEQTFKDHIFNSWFNGSIHTPFSSALSIHQLSPNSQGHFSASATVFYNQSTTPNCTIACPLVSNVIHAHNAFYRAILPNKTATVFLRRFPLTDVTIDLGIVRLVLGIVIGFATHFWLPSFLRFLVFERESKIRALMSMTGLKRSRYWLGTYIGFYLQYTLSVFFAIVAGSALRLSFFTMNTPISYIILFLLW